MCLLYNQNVLVLVLHQILLVVNAIWSNMDADTTKKSPVSKLVSKKAAVKRDKIFHAIAIQDRQPEAWRKQCQCCEKFLESQAKTQQEY